MKKINDEAIALDEAATSKRANAPRLARVSKQAFDDNGRVKYAMSAELEDGSVVSYSRCDGSEIEDPQELADAMHGVVETRRTDRTK